MVDAAGRRTFQAGYAEALKAIMEDYDLQRAIECLRGIEPESEQESWLQTDLLGALLWRTGRLSVCRQVLVSHKRRYPDDRRVDRLIESFRKACRRIRRKDRPTSP